MEKFNYEGYMRDNPLMKEDDSFSEAPMEADKKSGFDWKDFDDTDLSGPSVEMAIDDLIMDFEKIIKSEIPEELQYAARIQVKKLWRDKIMNWGLNK